MPEQTDYQSTLMVQATEEYTRTIRQPGLSAADRAAADAAYRERMIQILRDQGNAQAAQRLEALAPEMLAAVAQRIIDYNNTAAQNGLQALQSLIMADQRIVQQYNSGSVGILGFGKTLITIARMFVPDDNSEMDQFLDRAEERLDELLSDSRDQVQSARSSPTDDQLTRGGDLLNRALDSVQGTIGREAPQSLGRGPSVAYNGGETSQRSIQLADFVAAVTANTDLEANEKQALIEGATAFARIDDSNADELNAAEVALVQQSEVYRGLDTAERTSLNRAVPALVPAGP